MTSNVLIHAEALRFGHGRRALHAPLTLSIGPGEFWAIVGENGSGKTTLLRTLLGLHPPIDGEVRRGARAGAAGTGGGRVGIAYVPQRETVEHRVPMSVHAWIASGAERGRSFLVPRVMPRARASARRAVLDAAERAGCVELLKMQVGALSEGQKQRALIARAVVSDPRVLLLDEPTSAMDESAQERTMSVIGGLRASGTAVLVVSHQLRLLRAHATHGVVLPNPRATPPSAPLVGRVSELAESPLVQSRFPSFAAEPPSRRTPGAAPEHRVVEV